MEEGEGAGVGGRGGGSRLAAVLSRSLPVTMIFRCSVRHSVHPLFGAAELTLCRDCRPGCAGGSPGVLYRCVPYQRRKPLLCASKAGRPRPVIEERSHS